MAVQEQQHQPSSLSSSATGATHNVVGVHYRVGKKIGEGSFGIIYEGKRPHLENWAHTDDEYMLLGTNLLNNQQVAIKFEPRKSDAPQLRDEYRTYKVMAGTPGIPAAYYFGKERRTYDGHHTLTCALSST